MNDNYANLLSSTVSSLVSNNFVNIFEVIKNNQISNKIQCYKNCEAVTKRNNFQCNKKYYHNITCNNSKNIIETGAQLYRQSGLRIFTLGLGEVYKFTMLRSGIFYTLYEKNKLFFDKFNMNKQFKFLLNTIISRSLSIIFVFPFDLRTQRAQNQTAMQTKFSHIAFINYYIKEISLAVILFQIYENLRNKETFSNYNIALSAGVAGLLANLLVYPLELKKTINLYDFNKKNISKYFLKNNVTLGLTAKLIKSSLGTSIFFLIYENMRSKLTNN